MSVTELSLDLTQQTYTVITGLNASGKSALLEAISMALTDRRKGDSYRDYVKLGTKKSIIEMDATLENQDVYLKIEINNNKYGTPVKRTIKYKNEVYKNSECTNLLKELNVKYLQHITFFHQKDDSVLNLKPSDVSSLLKEIFDIDYTAQAEQISKSISEMAESSIHLHAELSVKQEQALSLKTTDLMREHSTSEKSLLKSISNVQKQMEAYGDTKALLEQRNKIDDDLTVNLGKLKTLLESKGRSAKTVAMHKEKLSQLISKIGSNEEILKEDYTDLEQDIVVIKEEITKIEETVQSNKDKIPSINAEIASLQRELDAYEKGACPVCHHDLTTEKEKHEHVKDTLTQKFELANTLNDFLSHAQEELSASSKKFIQKETALNTIKDKRTRAEIEIDSLKSQIDHTKEGIKSFSEFLENVDVEVETVHSKIISLENSLETFPDLDSKKEGFNHLKIELKALEEELAEVRKIKTINEERSRSNKEVEKLRVENAKKIDELKANINSIEKKIASSEASLGILLTDFPNYVILQKTKDLEESINEIVKKIFPEMKVKLTLKRSGISFYYSPSADIDWLPTKMASGAQAAILMLAWRISLAEMYGITTLCLDEIDADATDDNSALIYEFLGSLESFDQIILISHRKTAIKSIRDLNESVKGYWVEDGVYNESDMILD